MDLRRGGLGGSLASDAQSVCLSLFQSELKATQTFLRMLNQSQQEEAAVTSQRISFVCHHVEKPIKIYLKKTSQLEL